MVRVKICGITSPNDARAALRAGADAIGLVFAPSPRRITVEQARQIIDAAGPLAVTVGVFVNPTLAAIERTLRRCPLCAVQLHGEESPAMIRQVARWVPVIKAVRLSAPEGLQRLRAFGDAAALLCDTRAPGRWGGSGIVGDWRLAAAARRSGTTIILAGGLTPANVAEAVRRVRPYGVDVSSGVERSPGRKHAELMQSFVDRATHALDGEGSRESRDQRKRRET